MVPWLLEFLPRRTTLHIDLLIAALVRQTTVLITASGAWASLANVASQVFLDLVAKVKDRGVGNALIADIFEMVLPSYDKAALRGSSTAISTNRKWSLKTCWWRPRFQVF